MKRRLVWLLGLAAGAFVVSGCGRARYVVCKEDLASTDRDALLTIAKAVADGRDPTKLGSGVIGRLLFLEKGEEVVMIGQDKS